MLELDGHLAKFGGTRCFENSTISLEEIKLLRVIGNNCVDRWMNCGLSVLAASLAKKKLQADFMFRFSPAIYDLMSISKPLSRVCHHFAAFECYCRHRRD